jgi:hypothetical protein
LQHPEVFDYLCPLNEIKTNGWGEWIFGFGKKGYSNNLHKHPIKNFAIPEDVSRAQIYYSPSNSALNGMRMWDRKGVLAFEFTSGGFGNQYLKNIEIVLDKGERIVGVMSHNDWPERATH